MKKAFQIFSFILITTQSVFASSTDIASIVNYLTSQNGAMGSLVESYDQNNTGKCQLMVESDEYGTKVSFEQTGLYFTPVALVMNDAKIVGEQTILVSTSAKACGDYGGVVGYQKTLSVDKNQVQIRETFRCALEGFKKYDLATTCEL